MRFFFTLNLKNLVAKISSYLVLKRQEILKNQYCRSMLVIYNQTMLSHYKAKCLFEASMATCVTSDLHMKQGSI